MRTCTLLLCFVLSLCTRTAAAIDLRLTQLTTTPGVVEIANAHDGSGRLFLVQQVGTISILRGGKVLAQPFADLGNVISSGSERGLLGLAFAPDYAQSGRFYVYYTAGDGAVTIARMHVSASSPDVADPASREVLLSIPHSEFANHNGGKLAFGPDGFLYAGVGDGGGAAIRCTPRRTSARRSANCCASTYRRRPICDAREQPVSRDDGRETRDMGVRPAQSLALRVRSRDRRPVHRRRGSGHDRGDRLPRGRQCGRTELRLEPVRGRPGNLCEGDANYSGSCQTPGLTAPISVYRHGPGCSITGGYVYRGSAYPALTGMYLYGDYCSGQISG